MLSSKIKQFEGIFKSNDYFDLSSLYGYGGFCIQGDGYQKLNDDYDKFCIDSGFISEITRFHLSYDAHKVFSGKVEYVQKNVVLNLEPSSDELFMGFEHKVRKNIKKSLGYELEVKIDTLGEDIEHFMEMYYSTMDRTGAKKSFYFSKEFFNELNKMKNNFIYIYALHDNKIISAELVLYGSHNCYSFLGGTNMEYSHMRPNDFLKWEIINWAKQQGLKQFVLGGGYGGEDGIFKYKKAFAPTGIVDFYIGKKVFAEDKYNKLISLREKDELFDKSSSFFPLYRS